MRDVVLDGAADDVTIEHRTARRAARWFSWILGFAMLAAVILAALHLSESCRACSHRPQRARRGGWGSRLFCKPELIWHRVKPGASRNSDRAVAVPWPAAFSSVSLRCSSIRIRLGQRALHSAPVPGATARTAQFFARFAERDEPARAL